MFGRLMPREGKYFELFNAHVALVAEGGAALSALVQALVEARSSVDALVGRIDDVEEQADTIAHDIITQLHTAFITPFDREEIHALVNGVDNILDIIEDVAECVTLYDIRQVPAIAAEMASASEQCCQKVCAAVKLLDNMDNAPAILALLKDIKTLESDVDRLLRKAMSQLFREEPDVRQVLKLKETYQMIEAVSDQCKAVASTIETIVLENS